MILEKYRTGLYSCLDDHLIEARQFIERRKDRDQIAVEVLPLSNYIKSAEEHQQHLRKISRRYAYVSYFKRFAK